MPHAENRLTPRREQDQPERFLQVAPPPAAVPYERAESGASLFGLRDVMTILSRGKWLIPSLVLIAGTLTALYTLRTPPIYEATSTVRVEPRQNNFLRGGEMTYFYRSPEDWNTQIKTLHSPQLIRQVVVYLRLPENPSILSGAGRGGLVYSLSRIFERIKPRSSAAVLPPALADAAGGSVPDKSSVDNLSAEQLAQLEPYVGVLMGGLSVKPVENTNLISISFSHHDPAFAMNVVNAVARVHAYNEGRREKAGSDYAVAKLAMDIVELQQTIAKQEQERIEYLKDHDLPLGQAKGQNLTVSRLGTVSDQLLAAEDERKKVQASYEAALRATDPAAIPEVYQDKDVQGLRKQLGELEGARAKLLTKYTEEWPAVKEIDTQIAQLRGEIESKARNVVRVLKSRYDAALGREGEMKRSFSQEHSAANRQSQSELLMSSIDQRIGTNKQLYSQLFQRQKELEIESNGKASSVTLESSSSQPTEPLPQGGALKVISAMVAALFVGVGLSFLMVEMDDRLQSVEDIDRQLQLPTLALIPTVGKEPRGLKGKGGRAHSEALILNSGSRSLFTEAFGHLVTSITNASGGDAPRVILMASARAGEGKTMSAVNIAITLAQRGEKVLIMDCDLRRPQAHTYFDLPNDYGVTNCIAGSHGPNPAPGGWAGSEGGSSKMLHYRRRDDLDPALVMSCLHEHPELPNLKMMTAGWGAEKPTDFLASTQMFELLRLMREEFSYIIIDSPPITAFADASELAKHVDGAIIVVDGDSTSVKLVQKVKRRLAEVPVPIIGVVLNRAKESAMGDYANYYEYYEAQDTTAT